jgi:hypothetical protein
VTVGDPYAPQPQKKRLPTKAKVFLWIVAVVVAGLCALGTILIGNTASHSSNPGSTKAPVITVPDAGETTAAPTASPMMAVGDLQLKVKTLKKDCYGSAGCNVEYKIVLSTSTKVVPGECDITYQVNGLEDPQIGTLNVHADGQYEQDSYQAGETSSSSKKLTAKVTEIDCN